jgi:hypothetical protein
LESTGNYSYQPENENAEIQMLLTMAPCGLKTLLPFGGNNIGLESLSTELDGINIYHPPSPRCSLQVSGWHRTRDTLRHRKIFYMQKN